MEKQQQTYKKKKNRDKVPYLVMEARKEPPRALPRVSPASRPLFGDAARLDPALRKVQSYCDKWVFGGALTSPLLCQDRKKKWSSG